MEWKRPAAINRSKPSTFKSKHHHASGFHIDLSIIQDVICPGIDLSNFIQALEFVNKVGRLAESLGHHPDICLSWGKVKLTLTVEEKVIKKARKLGLNLSKVAENAFKDVQQYSWDKRAEKILEFMEKRHA